MPATPQCRGSGRRRSPPKGRDSDGGMAIAGRAAGRANTAGTRAAAGARSTFTFKGGSSAAAAAMASIPATTTVRPHGAPRRFHAARRHDDPRQYRQGQILTDTPAT